MFIKRYYILFLVFVVLNCHQELNYGHRNTDSQPAVASNCMVSSADSLATNVGLEILAKGGNAFDAAVAVAAALNVVEPFMSGIGGYGTILIYDADTKRQDFSIRAVKYLRLQIQTFSDLPHRIMRKTAAVQKPFLHPVM